MSTVTIHNHCKLTPATLNVRSGETASFAFQNTATANFSNTNFFVIPGTATYVSSISAAGDLQVDPNLAVGVTNKVTVSACTPQYHSESHKEPDSRISTSDDCVITVSVPIEVSKAHGGAR